MLTKHTPEQPLSSPAQYTRTVVIAQATNYGLERFQIFVGSLRKVYSGDVVLFVERSLPRDIVSFCSANKITTNQLPSSNSGHATLDRFQGYSDVCANYDWCLAADFRDTFFQANLFDSIPSGYDLVFAQEHTISKTGGPNNIKNCPYNSEWILGIYQSEGPAILNEIGDNPIICSGTVMGTPRGMKSLAAAMWYESKATGFYWADQGYVNALVYRNKLQVPVLLQPRGRGVINTIGYVKDCFENYVNSDGLVVNEDGSISPVVHQYDRFKLKFQILDLWETH